MTKHRFFLFVLIVMLVSCIDPYEPDTSDDFPVLLVVDGFLDQAAGTAYVKLNHSIPLSSTAAPEAESGAAVSIVDNDNNQFQLVETTPGIYTASGLSISGSQKYKLTISTSDSRKYESDFVVMPATPEIEKVTWVADPEELIITVSAQNSTAGTRYYRWNYTETWEYTSPYASSYKVVNGEVVVRPASESLHLCWRAEKNKQIITNTTTLLTDNVIKDFKLYRIPRNSVKLSRRLSIDVQLQALSEDAYTYWTDLKKNTESLGGLFDPLPSQVLGNIRCLSTPDEPVIGYFDGGKISSKRIFIDRTELPERYVKYFVPFERCEIDTIALEEVAYITDPNSIIAPVYSTGGPPVLIGYMKATSSCVDCRLFGGGTLEKPDFW